MSQPKKSKLKQGEEVEEWEEVNEGDEEQTVDRMVTPDLSPGCNINKNKTYNNEIDNKETPGKDINNVSYQNEVWEDNLNENINNNNNINKDSNNINNINNNNNMSNNNSNNNSNNKRNNNKFVFLASLMLLIAIIFKWNYSNENKNNKKTQRRKAVVLDCPYYNEALYFSSNSELISINGKLSSHPENTHYHYHLPQLDSTIFSSGEFTSTLKLENSNKFFKAQTIDITLRIDIDNDLYFGTNKCMIQIVFYDSPILGIDLGTTYTCVAYQTTIKDNVDKLLTHIMELGNKENCISSCVYFDKHNNILVGEEAKIKLAFDPDNTFCDLKRIMGRRKGESEIDYYIKSHNKIINNDEMPKIYVPNRNEYLSPEEMIAPLLGGNGNLVVDDKNKK